MTPETVRTLAMITRCAARQVDGLPPREAGDAFGMHVLWYLIPAPGEYDDVCRVTESQRALISVKLG